MKFRKIDYAISYIILSIILIANLINVTLAAIFKILTIIIIPTLILGTITNFIFKKSID